MDMAGVRWLVYLDLYARLSGAMPPGVVLQLSEDREYSVTREAQSIFVIL